MVTEGQPELPPSVLKRLKVLGEDIMNATPKEINAMQSPNDHPNQIAFADREAAIRKLAQELKPKLIRDDAPADGDCLFHSVAEQTIGKGEHMTVRASVVEEVNGLEHCLVVRPRQQSKWRHVRLLHNFRNL